MTIVNIILSILSCGISIGYLVLNVLSMNQEINPWSNLITGIILTVISITVLILNFIRKKDKVLFIIINPIILLISLFPLLIKLNILSLPTHKTIGNLSNKSLTDVLAWAKDNKITVNYTNEYSDNIEINNIISQDIDSTKLLNDVKEINLVVSSGPNYDKEIILPNMVGWTIDKVLEYINTNYLNNVNINYITSSYDKDTVIEQSAKGNAKRNSYLNLTLSYGIDEPTEATLKNLKNLSKFDAETYLKQNGINYELKYEYNNDIQRNYVIETSKNEGEKITKEEKLIVTISKGKEIKIPDLYTMNQEQIDEFIINNKLRVSYDDKYDDSTPLGKIISVNPNKDEIVEEGTEIKIVLSKGQLKMEKFTNVNEFKDWANKYGIKFSESYEFNDSSSGTLIGFSKNEGDIIGNDEAINVRISKGPSVTIPSFVGMNKNDITNKCKNIGLTCRFNYSGYNQAAYDTALSQSRTGGEVERGTVVTINLSLGPAKTYTLYLQSNWFTGGSTNATITALTNNLSKNYPGVNFKYVVKPANSGPSGGFHESSPTQTGTTVVQGKTYEIWIKQ